MILVALGANLSSPIGPPVAACEDAVARLQAAGVRVLHRSRWYESAPVPRSDQPWYVNGVVAVATPLAAEELLALLNHLENQMGRVRTVRNAPRVIDLDLLAYGDEVLNTPRLTLPHPRMSERAFVLLPLQEIAPTWVHPASGQGIAALVAALPGGQEIRVRV